MRKSLRANDVVHVPREQWLEGSEAERWKGGRGGWKMTFLVFWVHFAIKNNTKIR